MSDRSQTRSGLVRRVRRTPLRDLVRGRVTGRLEVRRRIDAAALPEPAKALVQRIVKRTRLWRLEKAELADELIAHFADGLEVGTPVEELIESFGDEKQAAKLIRRAKKRNRPWPWQVVRVCGWGIIALVVIYGLLIGWFAIGDPSVSVNYLAKLNAPARGVPPDQRAWPIYREALLETRLGENDYPSMRDDDAFLDPLFHVEERPSGREVGPLISPADPQWPKAKAFLQNHRDLLARIRRGASKSALGYIATFSPRAQSELTRRALYSHEFLRREFSDPEQAWKSQSIASVLLPLLGVMGEMADLLTADMQLAAVEGDAERFVADFEAIIGLARQQAREPSPIVSQLVAQGYLYQAFLRLSKALAARPALFTDAQLITLAHELAALDELLDLEWTFERMFFYDAIQSIYDQSGNITNEGLRVLHELFASARSRQLLFDSPMPNVVALPALNIAMADRAEIVRQFERLMTMLKRYAQRPFWEQLRNEAKVARILTRWHRSPLLRVKYWPLLYLFPAVDYPVKFTGQIMAARDALQVAIALELYRRDHGTYPEDLSALVPHYLPEPPVDHSTGEPLLYKVVEGQPILYGRGLDRDDDGGKVAKDYNYPAVPEHGDWLLYPVPWEANARIGPQP